MLGEACAWTLKVYPTKQAPGSPGLSNALAAMAMPTPVPTKREAAIQKAVAAGLWPSVGMGKGAWPSSFMSGVHIS